MPNLINDTEARINVTWAGNNADFPDPVSRDATDADIKMWVTETIQTVGLPGMPADPGASFEDFVIDRFEPTEARPYRLFALRPKTPFGRVQ